MTTDLKEGSKKPREEKYAIEKKGLFMFATANEFKYEKSFTKFDFAYRPYLPPKPDEDGSSSQSSSDEESDEKNDKTSDTATSNTKQNTDSRDDAKKGSSDGSDNKKPVIDKLKSAFKLETDPKNLIVWEEKGRRMTPHDTPPKEKPHTFKGLLEEIHKYAKQAKPSFLIFVLASLGRPNGVFFLSSKDTISCSVGYCSNGCKFYGKCQKRRIPDLVKVIQDEELFKEIPKIFLIQTVSGKPRSGTMGKDLSSKPPRQDINPDDYIPKGSDTFVFYAHTEQTVDWVNKNGFYLLDRFCDAIESIKEKKVEADHVLEELIELLKKEKQGDKSLLETAMSAINAEYQVSCEWAEESLYEAWLDNVCTTVAAKITDFLYDKKEGSNLRAHMSSTMRLRMSMLDVLRTDKTE